MVPRTQYVDSDGHSIAYQVIGSGPVDAFFEPGLLSHLDLQWCDPLFGGFLHQLASSPRLIITYQRGVGLSDACATIPPIDERAADMVAVADAVGTKQMFVIGHCHGGPPAIVFAATYPQRVAGLVLMSTFAKGAADADRPGALCAEDFDDWVEAIDRWGEGRSLTYFNPSRNDGPIYRQLYATFEWAAMPKGMARAAVASTLEIDVTAALKSVAAPTLVLHCSDDWMSIEAAKDIAAGIPSAHLVELDGADHAPFMGAASRDVLTNVLQFIGQHQRSIPAGAALRGNPHDRHRLVDEDGRSTR
jgi:pimeloyl-ACP methyl ester carboxylesterase